MTNEKASHWQKSYETKGPEQVSWTQQVPQPSLGLILALNLPKSARIIDCGGGDSTLADHLLAAGYQNITVLDIAGASLEKAKKRLGEKAYKINWIVADILNFEPNESFDLWHDRAVFHFLTEQKDIQHYQELVTNWVNSYLIVGTFSDQGPEKCSGLPVSRYDEQGLQNTFTKAFKPLSCMRHDHVTPFGTTQNFVFCSFKKVS
ncbi:class I SAM-dependent methyltransferase [Mucilaginibacter sp. Mucisp86]|uniref:class I SAM-dependent methyltransferase n=1 Tax=Mucilaginibacter sp. Mucisp86 TaxID=3243060 RepID=UPI0039B61F77